MTVTITIRDMVRVTAAKPNLMTDPANPNRTTLRTDPNGGGVVFGFTGLELGLVSVARRPVAVWLIRDGGNTVALPL